ncbi:extracellular solute-binding protein [Paenibacillus soyae]|uniref:Extracellular solute-binding protein n=1 Tax=Paenibacillus soyae TaxID=2969249 RepID=A0A9X2MN62_9BACL|nr:extracellular solute-binding protein [Paenibacillus soyae]MCR2803370.1 extracellular solute-binding protein [Paenibacillus soyae]
MKQAMSLVAIMSILVAVSTSCVVQREEAQETESRVIELTLWHNFTGDDLRAQTMRDIVREYQEANTNISLFVEAIPPDEYRSRLMAAALRGEVPDVFVMWSGSMTRKLAAAGLIAPINPLLEQYPEWRDGFLPNSLEAFSEWDFVYGAPMGLSPTSILYYNKDIFERSGMKVPTTWGELLHVIRHFNEQGITPIALGNKAGWLAQASIFSSIADRVTGTEWFLQAVSQNGARFTDPPFVEALAYMRQLGQAGAFQEDYERIDNVEMELRFVRGEAAMMIDGGWALTNMAAHASDEELRSMGATVLPAIPGGQGQPNTLAGVVGSGMALGVREEGARKEAALRLIFAMSGPDAQRRTLASNQLVSYKLALDKSMVSPIFAQVYDLVNSVRLTPVYDSMLTAEGAEALNRGLRELLKGGDPAEVAESVQEAHAAALAELNGSPITDGS